MKQLAKTDTQTSVQVYKPNLLNALVQGDKRGVGLALKEFKTHAGATNFPALLSIPSSGRLPALSRTNYNETLGVVTAGVTIAIEGMNLSRPMSSSQVVDLAEVIMESSEEDNLSLEDVMIFLQGLMRGVYGPLYESMDIPKFMEKFERYRDQRHKSMLDTRYEMDCQFSAAPVNAMFVSEPDKSKERDANHLAMVDYLKSQEPKND